MKQETNNEIDLLLRRLSRRQDGDLRVDADHLDADELSAYAENALPTAARARYTDHLAECSRCRELVVQLSSSVGVVVAAEETARAAGPSGFRKFLASLFSPMVLRYAVPALGLIVVAAIGLLYFGGGAGRRSPEFVARRSDAPTAVEQPQATSSPNSLLDRQQEVGSPQTMPETPAAKSLPATKSKDAETAPPPNAAPAVNVTAEVKPDASGQKPAEAVANEAPAQPAPKVAAATDEAQKKLQAEAKKQEAQDRIALTPGVSRQGEFQNARREDRPAGGVAGSASPQSSASPTDSRSLRMLESAGRRRAGEDEKDRDAAETRSVAGRRFRRQSGIWVDTAYNEGATVDLTLTRGSEQYRTLVADEPAIKTIADQLDGQIIVVWKGRVYRIR